MWLFVPLAVLGALVTMLSTIAAPIRFLLPGDRRLLLPTLEASANVFVRQNWDRRQRLLEETASFDRTRQTFLSLPQEAGKSDAFEEVTGNFVMRRDWLQAEIDAYLADFGRAAAQDRSRKDGLDAFNAKAKALARIETQLSRLRDSIDAGSTVDVTLFVAAQRFRAELETEREALVTRGLKPKKLSPLRLTAPRSPVALPDIF
jgi:hypothetical protein